jgi:RND family efflux transporter MFP subunit
MSKKTKLLGLFVALLCLGVAVTLLFVLRHMLKTDPGKARLVKGKMPVTLTQVKKDTIDYVIGATGQTQEFEKISLKARIEQPVSAVYVKLGDLVQPGQVLIEMEHKVMKAVVDQARSNLNKAETDLDYSKLNYRRFSNLYGQRLVAKVELEAADEKVKQAEYQYATAVQGMAKAAQDLNYTTVKSPIGGIVLERPINLTETPKRDDLLVSLGVIDNIYMLAKVAEEKVSYVQPGMNAEVLFDSFPNEPFKGNIVKIDPNTDPKTRTFVAYIQIDNKGLKLTPGLSGFARIGYSKRSLLAPSISIINPVGENATVFVVDSNAIAHIKRVRIGLSTGGLTEVLEGLQEGEKVVFAGIQALKDGDRVEIMQSES